MQQGTQIVLCAFWHRIAISQSNDTLAFIQDGCVTVRSIWLWTMELHIFLWSSEACKNSLNLPKFCRSDICESFFGVLPIEAEIDTRKLLFLGRLCRLHSTTLTKKMFAIRLYSFIYNLAQKQKGFIPDIFDIIQKYELTDHLKQWLHDGSFPEKITWKKIVRTAVSTLYKSQRQTRISSDSDFFTFRLIFDDIDPSSLWKLPRNCYKINLCKFVCKLISNIRECINVYTCLLCQRPFKNLIAHASCTCAATKAIRDVWWEVVINFMT